MSTSRTRAAGVDRNPRDTVRGGAIQSCGDSVGNVPSADSGITLRDASLPDTRTLRPSPVVARMSVATQDPLSLSTAPASWIAAALAGPAYIPVGDGFLATAPRLWLEWAADRVTKALARLAGRPVSLRLTDGPDAASGSAVYGIELSIAKRTVLVALDEAAARTIVDAVEASAAGLRGSGPLTEAEHGILDFVSLACVDELICAAPSAAAHTSISRLLTERDEGWRPGDATRPIGVRLCVGSRAGLCLVSPGDADLRALPPPPRSGTATAGRLELGFALPPVAVTRTEFESLAPGDTVLIGASATARDRWRGWLASPGGWLICPAQVTLDTPTMMSVRCGPLDVAVGPEAADGAGDVQLTALIGSVVLPARAVTALRDGDALDLPKSTGAPARLLCAARCVVHGELVAVEGEAGVRILSVEGRAGGGP